MKTPATVLIHTMAPAAALAQESDAMWHGHPRMDWHGGVGMMFGPIIWLIVLGLIVVGVVWAIRNMGRWSGPSESTRKSEAMDILRSRYARGEIDTAEFEERRQKLES